MGIYAALISSVAGATIPMIFGGGGPDYPPVPTMAKIDVQGNKKSLEKYAADRFAASKGAWADKFPLLAKGQDYYLQDILANQKGQLSGNVSASLKAAGLKAPSAKNQYELSKQIGLSPNTLSQRTTLSVNRQIAAHPELSNKISGGTLASMIANNYQNQQAFTQFLGAQNTAQYVAGQAQSSYNTAALVSGITGAAALGANSYYNYNSPLNNPLSYNPYQSSPSYMEYGGPLPPSPQNSAPPPQYQAPYETGYGNSWMTQPPPNYVMADPYG